MSLIHVPPTGSRSVAVRTKKAGGLALVNATLTGLGPSLAVADDCRRELQDRNAVTYLPEGASPGGHYLGQARIAHARMLSRAAVVDACHTALLGVIIPPVGNPITPAVAMSMLGVLFGTLGKGKGDNAALLSACADMFDPSSDLIGESTRLWKPVSRHPATLAIAVKKLLHTAVFTPSPSELRAAMGEADRKVRVMAGWVSKWVNLLDQADRIMFAFDRPAWERAYAHVSSAVLLVMQNGEEAGDEDEPASPRFAALEELRAKRAAEQIGRTLPAPEQPEAEPKPRIAACRAPSAKRTSKPRETADTEGTP